MENSNESTLDNSIKLRFDFIGMMFALAVGQVGLEISNFYGQGLSLFKYPHVASHLLLVIFIIASSWIGWQNSKAKGNKEIMEDTFGISFLVLLLDLFLVIYYFIIVKGVEKPFEINSQPDGTNEVFWSLMIFGTYIVWDILTKLISINNHDNLIIKFDFKSYFGRGYQAILCFALIFIFIKPITNIHKLENVILLDFALLCTFVLFRGLKVNDIFSNKNRNIKMKLVVGVILPLIGFTISLLINYFYYG